MGSGRSSLPVLWIVILKDGRKPFIVAKTPKGAYQIARILYPSCEVVGYYQA